MTIHNGFEFSNPLFKSYYTTDLVSSLMIYDSSRFLSLTKLDRNKVSLSFMNDRCIWMLRRQDCQPSPQHFASSEPLFTDLWTNIFHLYHSYTTKLKNTSEYPKIFLYNFIDILLMHYHVIPYNFCVLVDDDIPLFFENYEDVVATRFKYNQWYIIYPF